MGKWRSRIDQIFAGINYIKKIFLCNLDFLILINPENNKTNNQ